MGSELNNILVVDDHTLYRKGCMMLLESFGKGRQIFEASNGKEALGLMKEQPIDLVLMDLDMPFMGGMEAAPIILKNYPQTAIIMISMNDDLGMIAELIEIGVHSYLIKSAEPEELKRAIEYVENNDFYYNQLVSKALHKKLKDRPAVSSNPIHLTPREVEVLQLICEELTMKEIGDKLFLSEQTVHTHRKNLMKKVNVSNAVGLVKYALKEQFVHI